MSFQKFLKQRLALFVLLLVFVVYLPCLKAGFVNWDDDVHLLRNFPLRSLHGQNLSEIWTTTVNHTYIPLTTTTWAIEYHFFGYDPFIFHLDNILLHLAVTALVLIFSRRMGLSIFTSGLAALLFGIHPMHVESVAWVTERKDVLYGMFYMAALLAYLQYIDTGQRKFYWLMILLGVASICAKSMALSLPLVLLVLDGFYKRTINFRVIFEKLLCGAFLMPIAYATYILNSHVVEPATGHGPFIWVWCFMFYLYKFLYPCPLILFYGFPQSAIIFYLNVGVFIGLLASAWLFRRNRMFIFALAFYFANIFFLMRFSPQIGLVADRFMYIPSVGICMFLAVLAEKTYAWAKKSLILVYILIIILVTLIVVMAAATWRQGEVWQSSVNLWNNQLQFNSRTVPSLAYCKLADAYATSYEHKILNAHQFAQIRYFYQRSIDLNPPFAEPYFGLGRLYESIGDQASAESFFIEATLRDRKHFEAFFRLGEIYRHKGLALQAINFYHRAIAARPDNIYLCADISRAYDDSIRAHDHTDVYRLEELKMQDCR